MIATSLPRVSDCVWELPVSYKAGMRVPGRLFATRKLVEQLEAAVLEQLSNVACLPGIERAALCMPDGHSGYGFPIGGVAAFDLERGVVSPGGIGFDINCGMRLVRSALTEEEVRPRLKELVDLLYERVPAGVGALGPLRLTGPELRQVAADGSRWCLEQGLAWPEDLLLTEEQGRALGANPDKVSERAFERGARQLGTLGSGNHYLEVQVVRPGDIQDARAAEAFGLFPGQVVVMFHCGSRGFGHQVATDYLQRFSPAMRRHGIVTADRQLACAPVDSPEGRDYLAAMRCGLNFAFANRQVILHRVRECFVEVFGRPAGDLGLSMVYDVSHNTAKVEVYPVDGRSVPLLVHRKGATRAFGPGSLELPGRYRAFGQPVIIGGSMETGSYLLAGTPGAMTESFGSTAHGSGRAMSRHQAKRRFKGRELEREMAQRGIYVRSASYAGLAEEAGAAYKDIEEVVEAAEGAGISRKVARLTPIGNVKG